MTDFRPDPPNPRDIAYRLIATPVGRLAVRDLGCGNCTLVLWPSILTDHHIYDFQIAAWRSRYRLVVIDGPGHGDSGAAEAPFTMARCADAVAAILDALGETRPVVMVGTSWGGLVAAEFALAYAPRVRGIVMLGTPAFAEGRPSFKDRFVAWGARWLHRSHFYRDGVAQAFFLPATRRRGGAQLQAFHAHLRRADGMALGEAVRSVMIRRTPLASRLPAIAVPALFVAGSEDPSCPLTAMRETAARLAHGRFLALPARHIATMDAPEACTEAIDAFLESLQSDQEEDGGPFPPA